MVSFFLFWRLCLVLVRYITQMVHLFSGQRKDHPNPQPIAPVSTSLLEKTRSFMGSEPHQTQDTGFWWGWGQVGPPLSACLTLGGGGTWSNIEQNQTVPRWRCSLLPPNRSHNSFLSNSFLLQKRNDTIPNGSTIIYCHSYEAIVKFIVLATIQENLAIQACPRTQVRCF